MESHRTDAILVRSSHTKKRGKSTGEIYKSRERSKSPEDFLKKLY